MRFTNNQVSTICALLAVLVAADASSCPPDFHYEHGGLDSFYERLSVHSVESCAQICRESEGCNSFHYRPNLNNPCRLSELESPDGEDKGGATVFCAKNGEDSPTVDPTEIEVATIVAAVRNNVEQVIAATPTLAPKFIRLGFHDAVGGVDGCIDMTNGDNAGLDLPIAALDPIVLQYETADVSRADIWAIAALVAADVSLPNNQQGRFPLNYVGRKNCEDQSDPCPNSCNATNGPHRDLPSPDLTTHEILAFFDSAFGLSAQETVALMGAHTLGTMSPANSGFDGKWVNDELRLDNAYYGALVGGSSPDATEAELIDGPGWAVQHVDNSANGTPDRHQWVHTRASNGAVTVMTNSDMALVRDLNNGVDPDYLDESTGEPTCRFKGNDRAGLPPPCPAAAQTLGLMATYKHDNAKWVDDFEAVMEKMMMQGYAAPAGCVDAVCVLDSASTGRRLRGRKMKRTFVPS